MARLPRRPPSLEMLLAQAGGLQAALPVLQQLAFTPKGERYLHWDDLRHRPPPQGLVHNPMECSRRQHLHRVELIL